MGGLPWAVCHGRFAMGGLPLASFLFFQRPTQLEGSDEIKVARSCGWLAGMREYCYVFLRDSLPLDLRH